MVLNSPSIVSLLVKFLSNQIAENQIDYLIPLESKGALLADLALDHFKSDQPKPRVLYLRSIEYLSPEERGGLRFGVFDDFVFSGRTINSAISIMTKLGIPRGHIYPMAFFNFGRNNDDKDAYYNVPYDMVIPGEGELLRVSQDEILRDVQSLAIENKIPGSYDNLHWDIAVEENRYRSLMHDLADTGWFLYYGQRGRLDASALIMRGVSTRLYSVPPKIRFWYDRSNLNLRLAPISFSVSGKSCYSRRCAKLKMLLMPDKPTRRQRRFSTYQAEAISEQIYILSHLKLYFRQYHLEPKLNTRYLDRYFGPRATQVSKYLEDAYINTPEQPIRTPILTIGHRIDYLWVAIEIMRLLSEVYWKQSIPRKNSMGFSLSELIDRYAPEASVDTIHAAIDYCVDMNYATTFYRWEDNTPYRAFRLTENGEMEVGRKDSAQRQKLSFIEKLGAVIIYKSKNHEAYWWVLEKVPAILTRRLKFQLPSLEVAGGFYGDTTLLRPQEDSKNMLVWPHLLTEIWSVHEEPSTKGKGQPQKFMLSSDLFGDYKDEIFSDPEIIKLVGPIETLIELTKSKTMGHHVAILLDILADYTGGTAYLANALVKAIDLIGHRNLLSDPTEKQKTTGSIIKWLKGFDDKALLLTKRRERLLQHMKTKVDQLFRQGRGDLAAQLLRSVPFPNVNKIIPELVALSSIVRRVDLAMRRRDVGELEQIVRWIVPRRHISYESDNLNTIFDCLRKAIHCWAAALSAMPQDDKVYEGARLNVHQGESYRMFIVAYDLIQSTAKQRSGREGTDRNRFIQSIISNWFIAFGGYAQRAEFGGGDLGFGFFHSGKAAVQACLWAGYHLELLKGTNPLLQQKKPHAGFGIVQDELLPGFMKQVDSFWLSRFSKAWKHEAEHIADTVGRELRPIIAIHADLFSGLSELPREWCGEGAFLDGIPIRYIRPEAIERLPCSLALSGWRKLKGPDGKRDIPG
jgi:hypothetical protein